jgi:hypothetical protein
VDKELALSDAVFVPVETHVDSLGATLFDVLAILAAQELSVWWWLWPDHLGARCSKNRGFFAIEDQGFDGRGEDGFHDW